MGNFFFAVREFQVFTVSFSVARSGGNSYTISSDEDSESESDTKDENFQRVRYQFGNEFAELKALSSLTCLQISLLSLSVGWKFLSLYPVMSTLATRICAHVKLTIVPLIYNRGP